MLRTAAQWHQAVMTGLDRYYVRTALAVQQISRSGLTPNYTAANVDGHSIQNTQKEYLHVKTGGTGTTVTVVTPGTVDGQAIADKAYAIGTNTEMKIGPFPREVYDQSDGTVHVNFSSVTTVTCGAFRVE